MANLGKYISLGKVIEVYPDRYTATVNIKDSPNNAFGTDPECKILALRITQTGAASVILPIPGDMVLISTQHDKINPSIVGYYTPSTQAPRASEYQNKLTPIKKIGGENKQYEGGTNYIRNICPQDLMPGDNLQSGSDGQAVAILNGGSIIVKAANLCQLLLSKSRQTATLVARKLRIYTDFGEVVSESQDGLASLAIKGNSSTKTTNKYPEGYGTTLRLGGKELLNINLEKKFSVVINNAGHTTIQSTLLQSIMADSSSLEFQKDLRLAVKGTQINETGSNIISSVGGFKQLNISGKREVTVTGSDSKTVGGTSRSTYQGVKTDIIKGVGLLATDAVAYEAKIGAGDYNIDIGNPSAGGLPAPILLPTMGSFNVKILAGNINMNTNLGSIDIKTTIGTMDIGSTAGVTTLAGTQVVIDAIDVAIGSASASDPVVLALKLTQKLLTDVILKFNLHVHPPIVTVAGPQPVLPPVSQMSPISPIDVSNANVRA